VQPLRIALAQIAPSLGRLDDNLERHRGLIGEAREHDAGLLVFPELGLTGYLLQDLAAEVAMRLDDPRLTALAAESRDLSTIVSFVEESPDHRLFIAAALLEDGRVRHVHRKLFLPTYGLFDERRFFAAGDRLRASPSRIGVPIGLAVCEDFWHLAVPELLALDGAQVIVNVSSSPGRDLAATHEVGLGTASSWWTLMRTYAQLTTSIVVFCNRVGVDESISFWGGSEVVTPDGRSVFRAPLYDEGLHLVDVALPDVRRERISLPLLRDERPDLLVRELERIVAERAGLDGSRDGAGDEHGREGSVGEGSGPSGSDTGVDRDASGVSPGGVSHGGTRPGLATGLETGPAPGARPTPSGS
jgi:predicted amidohydrolase